MEKVVILFGGRSAEHEVSVRSATSIISAIDTDRYLPIPVGISKSGCWHSGLDPRRLAEAGFSAVPELYGENCLRPIAEILSGGDIIFPVLHGPFGEDGSIQGLLEVVNKPYVGSGVTASALGMDKVWQKTLLRSQGVPVVDFVWSYSKAYTSNPAQFQKIVAASIGYPCFVKPANMGSSVGISKVKRSAELGTAIDIALRYDHKVMVERAVVGREIECSVLGNEVLSSSWPGEIIPHGDFYDYAAKYVLPSKLIVRADLTPSQRDSIMQLALRTHEVLGCAGLSRVDFFLQHDGTVLVNELNTMPGFTDISMYPKMWEASGLSYRDLITRIIELGFERHSLASRNLVHGGE